MKSNITDQQYFATDLQLSEPHFDEEATLLSARPVVPLGEVRPQARSGRPLGFWLAIVFALMTGIFGGSLIYKLRGQKQATAVVESGTPVKESAVLEDQAPSGSGGPISDSQASPIAKNGAENVDDGATPAARSNAPGTETKRSAPLPPQDSRAGQEDEALQNANDYQLDEKELRRAERIDERRLRRAAEREAKREARGRKSRSSDDLLRIREIFEGSPRP